MNNTFKQGLKFLMENKQIQKMFKDLDKAHKNAEAVMKQAEAIKKKHKPS